MWCGWVSSIFILLSREFHANILKVRNCKYVNLMHFIKVKLMYSLERFFKNVKKSLLFFPHNWPCFFDEELTLHMDRQLTFVYGSLTITLFFMCDFWGILLFYWASWDAKVKSNSRARVEKEYFMTLLKERANQQREVRETRARWSKDSLLYLHRSIRKADILYH